MERQIKEAQYELRVLDLKLKDKDHEIKIAFFRKKEIEKQILDYRKLQRIHKHKEL